MLVFGERGKLEYPGKNLSEQSREPTNVNPHMTSDLVIEPGPHWWKASALTSAPTLPPNGNFHVHKTTFERNYSLDMYVMKPGHLDLLKNEVENGQIKMHYPEVLF